jgi:hypothetical protein
MIQHQAAAGRVAGRSAAGKLSAASLLGAVLLAALAAEAAAPAPIKLAIFDFELEDSSAGTSSAGETGSDATQLTSVTNAVRQLFAQSGRYTLVDVGSADAAAAKAHALRECDGCDAGIALKLGAEQSLVGVIRRISRTEYTVRFQIRDAPTGAMIAREDSGLRMGADYSWSRGAARLIKDRLLENRAPQ